MHVEREYMTSCFSGLIFRTSAAVESPVDIDPGMHFFQVFEHEAAVDDEVPHEGEFCEWRQFNDICTGTFYDP